MLNKKYVLMAILLLATFLRFYKLGEFQPALFRDEAALGYNAFSIAQTGRDEYGVLFPIVFRSFEVYFLPAYVYLSAPIVKILGLTVFSTRFLSALSGVIAVGLTYLISKRIFNEKTAVIATLLITISPWHIFYSRGTFEGNLALTFFAAGFLFWLRYLDLKNTKNALLSGILFSLSMYSYQAERLVVPLFALIAFTLSYKKIIENLRQLILPGILILTILMPLLSLTFKAGGYHRSVGVSIFSAQNSPQGWVEGVKTGVFVNNQYYLRGKQITNLYLSYFSPKNLFQNQDANRQRAAVNFSVFYSWFGVFFIFGFCKLFSDELNKNKKLLLAWIFLAPLPAAFTGDPFHTYRSLLLYLPLTIIIAFGINWFNTKYKLKFLIIFLTISAISLSGFLYSYFYLTPVLRAKDWDYGYEKITEFINKNIEIAEKVVVDDPLTEGYINYLFFSKTDPTLYQNEVQGLGIDPLDYYYTDPKKIRPDKIGNVYFREVDWPSERGDSGTIFVMHESVLPESEFKTDPNIELLKKFYYPNGEISFRALRIK